MRPATASNRCRSARSACAACRLAVHCVVDDRVERGPVDPVVRAELPVFRHHDRLHEHGRDVIEVDPLPLISPQQDEIAQHQRRNGVDEGNAVKQHEEENNGEQTQNRLDGKPQEPAWT